MERIGISLLLSAALSSYLAAEHPIRQPSAYSYSLDGPALSLECVGLLKANSKEFFQIVRSRSPEARRACVSQLLQSLTPEPEFTPRDFQNAIQGGEPPGSLAPKNPELARKMGNRLGVNLSVSQALAGLALGRQIYDPIAIHLLIQCLNHPLLEVSRRCEDALVSLTRHSYGWRFYYNQPPPPTEEARQHFVADWTEWEQQMKGGHPIFDEWLASRCLDAVHGLLRGLAGVLKDTVAFGYLDHTENVRLDDWGAPYGSQIFHFDVGSWNAANWGGTEAAKIGGLVIHMRRHGIANPGPESAGEGVFSPPRMPMFPDSLYREAFSALDLEVEVEVDALDSQLRSAWPVVVKEALAELRRANDASQASGSAFLRPPIPQSPFPFSSFSACFSAPPRLRVKPRSTGV